MSNSSRIILARELLQCAKMVLDESCLKMSKIIIAKPRDRIRNLVKKYDESGLYNEAIENGVIEEKCTIHHMSGRKYYIATDSINGKAIDDEYILKMECALKATSNNTEYKQDAEKDITAHNYDKSEVISIGNSIREEIRTCVLIPITFHNWLNGHLPSTDTSIKIKEKSYPLNNRTDYYKFLRKFASDKAKLKKVSKIKYDDTTLISAINSLHRLSAFISPEINKGNDRLAKTLINVYKRLQNIIKRTNLALAIQDDICDGVIITEN